MSSPSGHRKAPWDKRGILQNLARGGYAESFFFEELSEGL